MTGEAGWRTGVALAWLVAVITALSMAWLVASGSETVLGSSWMLVFSAIVTDVIAYVTVGALLSLKRPGNVIGPILMAGGILVGMTFFAFLLGAILAAAGGEDDVLAGWAALIGAATVYPAIIVAGPALAVFVPDGRLPGPTWRWAVGLVVLLYGLGMILILGRPGPIGESLGANPLGTVGLPWSGLGDSLSALSLPLSLALAVTAVVVRYRRAVGIERAQLKWFVSANVAFAVFMLGSFADGASTPTILDQLALSSMSLIPVAIGIAILRYRLYEIDRIVGRTVAYALVTAVLAAVFIAVNLALQALLADVTGSSALVTAVATLAVAALFQPLRRRIQRMVDHRFNRRRVDAQRTIDTFGIQLRDQVDLDAVHGRLLAATDATVQPAGAAVWLRGSSVRAP